MNNEFSVYWWDREFNQHEELRFTTAERAMSAIQRLTQGPASALGIVSRAIITDSLDCIVFEWKEHLGVTWPKKEDLQ